MDDQYYTVDEVCHMLGICHSTMYRLIKINEIPAEKVGRCWKISKEKLDQILQLSE